MHLYIRMDSQLNHKNVSPLRYPGGKTRACKVLDSILNEYFSLSDIDVVISPFFGGGSFEFYIQHKYGISQLIVNDKFQPLFNFWRQCQINNVGLCGKLREMVDVSKQDFMNCRNTILSDSLDELTSAAYYFIINRCSFSGATLSGGFSEEASKKRYTASSIKKIEELDLTKVEFHNLDYADFFEYVSLNYGESSKQLWFVDPPYYLEKGSKLYGKNGDLHEFFDHESLFTILNKTHSWILTYNNCDYIKNLYKDYLILDAKWTYGMNLSKESSEIIIISIVKSA